MPQRWLTGDLQGYISWRLISRPGARAGEGKDDASRPAVNRKCHPLVMPITAALGRLPALTTLRLYAFCSDVRGRMALVSRRQRKRPCLPKLPCTLPVRSPHALMGCTLLGASGSPSALGRSAVGRRGKVCCSFPERLEEQSKRSSFSSASSCWELMLGLNPGCPCPGEPLSANLPSADAQE